MGPTFVATLWLRDCLGLKASKHIEISIKWKSNISMRSSNATKYAFVNSVPIVKYVSGQKGKFLCSFCWATQCTILYPVLLGQRGKTWSAALRLLCKGSHYGEEGCQPLRHIWPGPSADWLWSSPITVAIIVYPRQLVQLQNNLIVDSFSTIEQPLENVGHAVSAHDCRQNSLLDSKGSTG